MEEFRLIENYGSKHFNYYVTNFGKVIQSYPKGITRELKYHLHGGYYAVNLGRMNENKTDYIMVHRLVAQYFHPNPEKKKYVNHKDGKKFNNNADNLEWVTAKENSQHALRTGLTPVGENRKGARFLNCEIRQIRRRYLFGMSGVEIAKIYGCNPNLIYNILNDRNYKWVKNIE